MKIGIFGGSFNPPHNMHKDIALNLIKNNYIDKVIYVPTSDKYNKNNLIKYQDRYNMLNILCKNNNNLSVSDYEQQNTLVYTYQTLDYFKKLYPNSEIYFICGSDNLNELITWKNYEYILSNYKILVIKRNEDDINELLNKYKDYKNNIIFASIPLSTLSSTILRDLIKTKHIKLKEYIDDKVLEYIYENNLYN